jgi:hypothetical protein
MDNLTNFDKLITNLSSNEKKSLLEKVEITLELSQEPLAAVEEVIDSGLQNFQQEYESLTVLQKILLFIQSLVKQKDIPTLLKEYQVGVLRKKYFANTKLADFKNLQLLQPFYDELSTLKTPCQFFRIPLLHIFSSENKQDFYAFMGGIILPDLQQDLLLKADPWEIEKKDHKLEDSYIKSEIDTFMEMKLDSVSDLDCSIMNEACQSLYGLHLLSSFDLSLISSQFHSITPELGKTCQIQDVHEQLLELAGILQSLNKPPSVRAMEAMFLYSLENQDLKGDLGKMMVTADTFLSVIRDFNKKVPLENLVKVLSGELGKGIRKPPVVEDWFRVYKKFWNYRVNRRYALFVNERKRNEIERDICVITGLKIIKPLDRYSRDFYWKGSPAKYEKSLAFILAFLNEILPNRLNSILMTISREGEFYKKDNKIEFDKIINYFDLVNNRVISVTSMIQGNGFLGERLIKAANEGEDEKKKTILSALDQIDIEVYSVLDGFISHMRILNKLFHGIVIGDGGAYDTLSNISSIGGRTNPELREAFKLDSQIINKIVKYISEMKILEEKKL